MPYVIGPKSVFGFKTLGNIIISERQAIVVGGGLGSGAGTFTTEILNNALDRTSEQQVSAKEIAISVGASAITGAAVSTLTAGFNAQVDDGSDLVASRISTPRGDKVVFSDPFNPMEKELLKACLGGANDCMGGQFASLLELSGESIWKNIYR